MIQRSNSDSTSQAHVTSCIRNHTPIIIVILYRWLLHCIVVNYRLIFPRPVRLWLSCAKAWCGVCGLDAASVNFSSYLLYFWATTWKWRHYQYLCIGISWLCLISAKPDFFRLAAAWQNYGWLAGLNLQLTSLPLTRGSAPALLHYIWYNESHRQACTSMSAVWCFDRLGLLWMSDIS